MTSFARCFSHIKFLLSQLSSYHSSHGLPLWATEPHVVDVKYSLCSLVDFLGRTIYCSKSSFPPTVLVRSMDYPGVFRTMHLLLVYLPSKRWCLSNVITFDWRLVGSITYLSGKWLTTHYFKTKLWPTILLPHCKDDCFFPAGHLQRCEVTLSARKSKSPVHCTHFRKLQTNY